MSTTSGRCCESQVVHALWVGQTPSCNGIDCFALLYLASAAFAEPWFTWLSKLQGVPRLANLVWNQTLLVRLCNMES